MKSNIFILHSLNGDTLKIWGQDLKETFERNDIDVIMPEFPIRAESKYEKFRDILDYYYVRTFSDTCIGIIYPFQACFVNHLVFCYLRIFVYLCSNNKKLCTYL